MKAISDSSYKKLFEMKKYKDLYDFTSLECRVAIVMMVVFDIVFCICSSYIGADVVVGKCVELLDDIGIELIGFLGFVVSALAILTGAISSKVVKRLQDRKKMDALERIMLSFYLMGLVGAFVIIVALILHFLIAIPVKSIFIIDIVLVSLLSYLFVFIIFYAVKLIGNCLELFYIVNRMLLIEESNIDYKAKYNNYRIAALEKIQLSSTSAERVEEYRRTIQELIENDANSIEEQQIYMKMHKEQFREWLNK